MCYCKCTWFWLLLPVGKAKYANGEKYMGQWRHGKRHGQGRWTSAPITVAASPASTAAAVAAAPAATAAGGGEERRETYAGQWVDDCREGQGLAVYADGGRWACNAELQVENSCLYNVIKSAYLATSTHSMRSL